MKRRLRVIAGVAISVLFLYLAARGIDWAELGRLFRTANYAYLIPAFLLLIAINGVRAYRWRVLMYPDGNQLSLPRVFWFVNIGYFFNNVFPAKLGELVRGYLAGRAIRGGIGRALSALLLERLLDVLSVVVLLVVLIPFVDLPPWAARAGLIFGGAAVGGTVALLVLSRFGDAGVAWLWRYVGRIPLVGHAKVRGAVENLVRGFGVLSVGRAIPGIILGSALVWLGYATFNYTIMAAFHMTDLPFSAAALVLCATGFSMVLPSSPGAMGVFEWAGVQALAVYGVEQSLAFGYTLGLHLFTNVVLIAIGLLGLLVEGLSYADIRGQVALPATASPDSTATPS
jgi:glycosyltransferase 2 family protein